MWHSVSALLDFSESRVDTIVLYCFIFLFMIIQIMFAFSLLISYNKIKLLKEKEKDFLEKLESVNEKEIFE